MGSGCVCLCIIFLTVMLSLTIYLCFLSQSFMPRIYLQDFYVPQLQTTLAQSPNTTMTFIFFDLDLRNRMEENGLRYDDIHISFQYGSVPVANYTVPGFYQHSKNTANYVDVVETRGVPWSEALTAVSNGSSVVFRVDLETMVKVKRASWFGKSKRLVLGANVEVNGFGEKVRKKGIRLLKTQVSGHVSV